MRIILLRLAILTSSYYSTIGYIGFNFRSSSGPEPSHRQASAERTKYLTYKPSENGFGNRLQTFQIAFILAQQSGRTLISRPFSDLHKHGLPVPYTAYLRPIDPNVVRVVEDFDVPNLHELSNKNLRFSPWKDCNRDLQELLGWIRSHEDIDVITYNYQWGNWEAMFKLEDVQLITPIMLQHVRKLPEIEEAARTLMSYLPPNYSAMHMRLGDRTGHALINCTRRGLEFQPRGYACQGHPVKPEDAFEYTFRSDDSPKTIYVATNVPGSPHIRRLRTHEVAHQVILRMWESFPGDVIKRILAEDQKRFLGAVSVASQSKHALNGTLLMRQGAQKADRMHRAHLSALSGERSGTLVSLIEQEIVIHAQRYLPAIPSSWDSYVITLRFADRPSSAEAEEHYMLLRDAIARAHCAVRTNSGSVH